MTGPTATSPPRPVVGLLIPEFPQQTHCAWWRVGRAFATHGHERQMLSTRPAPASARCHDFLIEQSRRTHYCWPPNVPAALGLWLRRPAALWAGLRYIAGLRERGLIEKLKALPLLLAGADLCAYARRRGLAAIFVHSCANAAHVVALARVMGGPPYALRLGGDLEVYGKDHASKMRHAAFIASSAPAYIPDIKEQGVPDQRIMWTWVGADLEQFTPGDRSWQRQDPESLHAVTVARLTDTKGHADVLDAIATLRDRGLHVRYSIIGAGPQQQAIRDQAARLGIDDRIDLLGAKSMSQVIEVLRKADVSILASYGLGESSPAVVAEAMGCGVPVICTRIGATELMFNDGQEGLLVPQRDPDALAEALEQLHRDEPRRQRMAHAALEHAPVFDCRQVARRVLEHFGLLGESAGAPLPTHCADSAPQQPRCAATAHA